MRMVLLGTGGYHPSNERQTACMMLPELGIILDAGTAMFRVREYIQTAELHIFLSHAHLDHVFGLTGLFDILHEREVGRVVVHGDAQKLTDIQQHLLDRSLFPVPLPCEWQPLDGPTNLPDDGQLTYFPLVHPGGSLGFRLDWPGHSLAYVTDTIADPQAPYVERIQDVDVLIHECYFPDSRVQLAQLTGHSCATPVAQVARAARAGRLILVHANPLSRPEAPFDIDTIRRIYPHVTAGYDGLEVVF